MHTAILDADGSSAGQLANYIKQYYKEWSVQIYSNTFALATAIHDELKGDVELLMIHVMSDGENVEIAKDLQDFFPHIRIIFYSESTDCAEDIFKAVPSFFLKLPFCMETVRIALERVKWSIKEDTGRVLTILSSGQKQKIRFTAIRYIESVGRKLYLYTDEGSYDTYMTIREVLEMLPPQFMQCHRSYIVNTDRVEQYGGDELRLTEREAIPISRTFHKQVKAILDQSVFRKE